MERDWDYENKNIAYDEQYTQEDGGGIKCKHYEICECVLPTWWFECKHNYLCTNCHMMFGHELTMSDNSECGICLETKRGVSQPNCDHVVCIDCFKRCYYGDNDESEMPLFPYPKDVEDEYDNDMENSKWEIDYPLIAVYNEEFNTWYDNRRNKYETEKYLRCCPFCRK